MAVACPTSFPSSMSLDAPFEDVVAREPAESFDRESRIETLPSVRDAETAPGLNADKAWDFAESEPPAPLTSKTPEWCIDLGDRMIALHAVELYTRLATGAIAPTAKVWRCGREAWTPANQVPELRYAIEDAAGPDVDPVLSVRGEIDADDELMDALSFAQAG
jgi:hypothetical protein